MDATLDSASFKRYPRFKKLNAGLSYEKYTELLHDREEIFRPFYTTCLYIKQLGTCGPRLDNGKKIKEWKTRELVWKSHIYYAAKSPLNPRPRLGKNRDKSRRKK